MNRASVLWLVVFSCVAFAAGHDEALRPFVEQSR